MIDALRHLLDFVGAYPHLIYALIFLVAFSEAVPVAGAIIPGSSIIIGLSALVATGNVGLWPVLGWAIVGAIGGDAFSYWLGRHHHRAILKRWPFTHYPMVIARSEDYFRRHGAKSVFLGRFVPALRAFVPLFAGILGVAPARFYAANIASALAWAPIHVLPGVALGASLALAGAVASRLLLFLGLLALVVGLAVWMAGLGWRLGVPLVARAVEWARDRAERPGGTHWLLRSILYPRETEVRGLLVGAIVLIGAIWLFLGILENVATGDPLVRVDVEAYRFLQGLRSPWADALMVGATELGDTLVVVSVAAAVLAWLLWQRAWRTSLYWVAAVCLASLFNTAIKLTLDRPRPLPDLYVGLGAFSFPSGHSTVNTAMWGFLAVLVIGNLGGGARVWLIGAIGALISLIAFSRIYLGAHWLSDVIGGIAFATAWITLLGVAYINHRPKRIASGGLLGAAIVALLGAGAFNIDRHHAIDTERYAMRQQTRAMTPAEYSGGGWQSLAFRRIDLEGELNEALTVQWASDPGRIVAILAKMGWRPPAPWTLENSLLWLVPDPEIESLPVLPMLDNGRLAAVSLILKLAPDRRLVLRLWESGVELQGVGGVRRPVLAGFAIEENLWRMGSLLTLSNRQPNLLAPRDRLAASSPGARLVQRSDAPSEARWDGGVLLIGDAPTP